MSQIFSEECFVERRITYRIFTNLSVDSGGISRTLTPFSVEIGGISRILATFSVEIGGISTY